MSIQVAASVASLDDAGRRLLAAARDFAAAVQGAGGVPEADLSAGLDAAAAVQRLLDGATVGLVGEVRRRSALVPAEASFSVRHGHRNLRELVTKTFGVRSRRARELIGLAEQTSEGMQLTGGVIPARYPLVGEALADGTVTMEQAVTITACLETTADRAAVQDLSIAEACLVEAATGTSAELPGLREEPELLRQRGTAIALLIDPDGPAPTDEQIHAARSFTLTTRPDGAVVGRLVCTAEQGETIQNVLDAYVAPRRVAFDEPVTGDEGLPTPSMAARRVDALVGVFEQHAASKDAPVYGGTAPTLVVTATLADLDRHARLLNDHDAPQAPHARLERDGAIVPIDTAARVGCTDRIQLAILDDHGTVLRLGREQRLFTPAQRRALWLRYQGCAVGGCTTAARWVEAHHATPWLLGGTTDLDNGVLLCPFHHHAVHRGLLHTTWNPDRRRWHITTRPPDEHAPPTG